jgi:hypothetical protein
MIKLAPVVRNKLLQYHARVYFVNAPSTPVFPFVTFSLSNSVENAGQEIFNLDVDVWGNTPDTTVIDTLAQTIWRSLNRYHHIDADIQFTIYRMNRLILDDDDPQIQRRKLIFQLRYMDRGLNNE